MNYEQILYSVDDRVLTLTLNRPEKLNAFTAQMLAEMLDALDRADADDDVARDHRHRRRRAFCAGADLSSGSGTFDARAGAGSVGIEQRRDGGGRLTLRIYDCKKPIIAAMNGPPSGWSHDDSADGRAPRLQDARFGFVFARRGICLEAASSWFLPRVVGVSRALEWGFSGRVFPASEALAAGLVRSLHAPNELLPAARELAREIADNTRDLGRDDAPARLEDARRGSPDEAHKLDSRAISALGRSADAHEGVGAFLEKRPANFRQRRARRCRRSIPGGPSGSSMTPRRSGDS